MPAEEAAAAVTPRTQLAADLQGSLTRHARAKEADVTPLDELSRDAVHAQHAWLYDSMKQTSLLLSSQGDTPRGVSLRSESDGVLPPTNSPPSIPPSISTNTDWYSSKAEDSLSRRAMLGFDGMPKLDPATAENDKAAREEAVKAQQGWMASLLMQMSQSFSPRDSRRSSVYGGASLGASALGTPVVSPVGPPDPNMSAEQSAADLAAREEALRSQQGWLAGLIAAMSNRNSINSALSLNSAMADSHRARSAADLGVAAADLGLVADGTDSEADRASRAEAVRAQQGWLANMLYGMQSFMGQSTETLGGGNTEASADNKTREEQEADLKAREEALRSQQGWLAGLLSGMSRDSLHAIPWAQQPTGTSPSATPKRTSSPGLLRRDSSVLVGSPMRAGAGVSFCLLEEEDEKEAREWELEQARLALEAAQREADAHNGSAPVQSCPRVVRPAAPPLRETPSTVKARSAAALPAAVLPAPARVAVTRAAVAVPGDDTTDDKGPVYKPDMEVYSHLARKQVCTHAVAVKCARRSALHTWCMPHPAPNKPPNPALLIPIPLRCSGLAHLPRVLGRLRRVLPRRVGHLRLVHQQVPVGGGRAAAPAADAGRTQARVAAEAHRDASAARPRRQDDHRHCRPPVLDGGDARLLGQGQGGAAAVPHRHRAATRPVAAHAQEDDLGGACQRGERVTDRGGSPHPVCGTQGAPLHVAGTRGLEMAERGRCQ